MRPRLRSPLPFPFGPRTTTPLPQPHREVVPIAGGEAVACAVAGPAAGDVVVAVHGFRGSDMGLQGVLAALPEARVVSPNLPGMGVTPVVPGVRYDVEACARVVTEVVEGLGVGPVWLVGHSYGTIVATAAAVARPDLVRGLVLLAPVVEPVRGRGLHALGIDAIGLFFRAVAAAPTRLGTLVSDSKFPGEQSLPFLRRRRGSWPRVQQLSHEQLPSSFDRRAVVDAHVASTTHGCAEMAEDLQIPVAVVGGSRDQFATPAMLADLARRSGARYVRILPGAGHLMHYEDTDDVAAAVREALLALGWSGVAGRP